MPELSGQTFYSNSQLQAFHYTHLGTAAGTTTLSNVPAFLHLIQTNQRSASGTIVVYDSAGTSASVVGSIVFGTQTNADNPPPYLFDIATKTGLTISNSANIDLTVSSLP